MKTVFKKIAFGTGMLALGLGLGVYGLATANDLELDVAQELSELTLTLQDIFVPQEQQNNQGPNEYAPNPQAQLIPSGVPNPTCLDNYQDWNHSNAYTDAEDWNVDFLPHAQIMSGSKYEGKTDQFLDVNGDGLADYVYALRYYYQQNGQKITRNSSCVYLNTGRGFESVYRCVAHVDHNNDTEDYWGDCAEA